MPTITKNLLSFNNISIKEYYQLDELLVRISNELLREDSLQSDNIALLENYLDVLSFVLDKCDAVECAVFIDVLIFYIYSSNNNRLIYNLLKVRYKHEFRIYKLSIFELQVYIPQNFISSDRILEFCFLYCFPVDMHLILMYPKVIKFLDARVHKRKSLLIREKIKFLYCSWIEYLDFYRFLDVLFVNLFGKLDSLLSEFNSIFNVDYIASDDFNFSLSNATCHEYWSERASKFVLVDSKGVHVAEQLLSDIMNLSEAVLFDYNMLKEKIILMHESVRSSFEGVLRLYCMSQVSLWVKNYMHKGDFVIILKEKVEANISWLDFWVSDRIAFAKLVDEWQLMLTHASQVFYLQIKLSSSEYRDLELWENMMLEHGWVMK